MNEPLFRRQAMKTRAHRGEGQPRIVTPPSFWFVTLLVASLLTVLIVFLSTNTYTRKETVTGVIEAGSGIKRVYVPRSGVLSKIHVERGQAIQRGQTIATFEVPPPVYGEARTQSLDEYDRQLRAIEKRSEKIQLEFVQEQAKVDTEIERIKAKVHHIDNVARLEREKVEQLEGTHEAALPLYRSGQLSRIEWGRFSESLINARQRVEQLASEQLEMQKQEEHLRISKQQIRVRHDERLIALQQEASRVEQAKLSLSSEAGFAVTAPVSGRIADLFLTIGANVTNREPIASVQENGAQMRARLLIPSRSAGFIEEGQLVRLLYDAFPHQQFGTHPGKILRVSSHALLPGDLANISPREPVFEAIVEIESNAILAYGKHMPLRSGMSLKADILLDHRSLIEWLLEPLFAKRGRTS